MEKLLYTDVKVITKLQRPYKLSSSFLSDSDESGLLTYSGLLKANDPFTKSVILCHIKNDEVIENMIILGHTIDTIISNDQINQDQNLDRSKVEAIVVEDISNKCKNNLWYKNRKLSTEDTNNRCLDIVEWLVKNRIPACIEETSKDIIIADDIRVQSPYEHISDYKCPTRIILKRIKTIIDSREKFRTTQ